MSPHVPENREHPRYAVAVAITIDDGERRWQGTTTNLSRGGVALELPVRLEVSTLVRLEMALDFGDSTFSEPLIVAAVVVWCTRVGTAWQLGVKFAGLGEEQRAYLDLFLRFLDNGRAAEAEEDSEDEEDSSDGGVM